MNNEMEIEFTSNHPINTITKSLLQNCDVNLLSINCCFQGINYPTLRKSRDSYREHRNKTISSIMDKPETISHKLCRYKSITKKAKDLFYQFDSFNKSIIINHIHNQLRKNLILISDHELVYYNYEYVELYNLITKQQKILVYFNNEDMMNHTYVVTLSAHQLSQGNILIAFGKINSTLVIVKLNNYKLEFRKSIRLIEEDNQIVNHIQFTPEGNKMICSSNDGHIRIINISTLIVENEYIYNEPINHFCFHSKFNLISAVGDFSEVLLFDSKEKDPIFAIEGHKDHGFVCKFNEEYYLASGNQDLECRLWDIRKVNNGKEAIVKVLYAQTNSVGNLDFKGNKIVYYENTDFINIYDRYKSQFESIIIIFW